MIDFSLSSLLLFPRCSLGSPAAESLRGCLDRGREETAASHELTLDDSPVATACAIGCSAQSVESVCSVGLSSPLSFQRTPGTGRPTGGMATSQDVPLFPCLLIWKDLVEKRNGGFERERKIEREECQGFQFLFNFYVVHKNSVLCLSACLQRKGDKERKWSKSFGIKQPDS